MNVPSSNNKGTQTVTPNDSQGSCVRVGLGNLRFDIFERIHLEDGLAPIKEMIGHTLDISIDSIIRDEYVDLIGNLTLTFLYMTEREMKVTNRHQIPVEISIPQNRIQEGYGAIAGIDSYNVDVLSGRLMNLTGILVVSEEEVCDMGKVKITKDQAEQLEHLQTDTTFKNQKEEIVRMHADNANWHGGPKCLNELPLDTLIRALYIGYEVEQTPEENVKGYYDRLDYDPPKSPKAVVADVLDMLNITIKGVNDQ